MRSPSAGPTETTPITPAHSVSVQQRHFFRTFGFLRFDGLFARDADEIVAAFDEVASGLDDHRERPVLEPGRTERYRETFEGGGSVDSYDAVHFGRRRVILPNVLDQHERLNAISSDPRFTAAAEALLGPGYELLGSDGNVFYCDTAWHFDSFLAPVADFYVKFFLYLDPVAHDSGALRVIPGSHAIDSPFSRSLRAGLLNWDAIGDAFGASGMDIPCWTIPSEPGDLIACYYRIQHATFGGGDGRRLIAINMRGSTESADGP